MYKNFKYIVTDEDYKNKLEIKDFLRKHFSFSSRLITKIKKHEGILLNGEVMPNWVIPKPGDIITVKLPPERSNFEPEDIPINVAYEDDDLLIINKQPGYIVHPTSSHNAHTIANGIAKYCIDTSQEFKLRFVNRLDRDTSGLLILGKNSHCQDKITKQMHTDKVKKIYIALVCGNIYEEEGVIDLPIGRPDKIGIKRAVMENGSPCITNYKVLKRFKDVDNNYYTLLQLQLETGRTHQIRVHMSYIDHPIVADTLYGTTSSLIARQALHAKILEFYHPVTLTKLHIQTDIPDDIQKAMESLIEI